MKALIAAFAALVITTSAFASDRGKGQRQYQGQHQGQAQAQIQGQIQGLKNSGSTVNVSNNTNVDAEPAATATYHLTSTGCIGSIGGGGQAPVVGVSVGVTRDHVDCFKIEVAKLEMADGDKKAGEQLLCSIDWYHAAVSKCAKIAAVAALERKLAIAQIKQVAPEVVALATTIEPEAQTTE